MELFSEIYSTYFKVVSKILNASYDKGITKEEIVFIINNNAFSESTFYILPKLIEGEWQFLENKGDLYTSKLNSKIKLPLSMLEKSWLKALLYDKRITLFLEQDQINQLIDFLEDVEPLFDVNDFYYFDCYSDGDNYADHNYKRYFRTILAALKKKQILKISFESGKGEQITGNFLPCKIEYSSKDNKFRVHVLMVRYGKIVRFITINIARISSIETSSERYNGKIDFYKYLEQSKCSEPVVIEISNERNAVERCMLHFANYEKRTEYDKARDKYISYLYYDKQDETELLIRILSFGPVIKVLGPENFLSQVKERIERQAELLKTEIIDIDKIY